MIRVRLIGAVLVFAAAAFVSLSPASATTCAWFPTAERVKFFPFVFEATVTSARRPPPGQVLTVDITRVWKGDVGAQRTLLQWMPMGEVPLVVGQTYVIFAEELHPQDIFWRNRDDIQLTGKELGVSSGCDAVIPIERAGPVLNELGPAQPSPSR